MRGVSAVSVLGLLLPAVASAATTNVGTVQELAAVLALVNPGDEIVLADGTYTVAAPLACDRAGSTGQPIVVRALNRGKAIVRGNGAATAVFSVSAPFWVFDGLVVTAGRSFGIWFRADGRGGTVR